MSKAFLREDDDRSEEMAPRRVAPLPGGRILLTSQGAARLRDELRQLREAVRPEMQARIAAGGAAAAEAQEILRRVNARLAYLQQTLAAAEVVGRRPPPHDTVQFGATVTVRDGGGLESVYRIVGVEEADAARDEVSWVSPLARALLNARLGQRVVFRFPRGEQTLEVVRIAYEE